MENLLINFAFATDMPTTTRPELFTSYMALTGFENQFWGPFGGWILFAISIAVAMMIFRRIRGSARRPR